jgi:AcrR family transcriptional regulator
VPPEDEGTHQDAGLPRLPPGRHGLPREFVVENQRQRIAAGMISVVAERGYTATTVTQIVAAGGVSRRTFYNYYRDKQEAFFDVYGQVSDFLLRVMSEAAVGGAAKGGWASRVEASLAALLEGFTANPELARFCLAAPPAAGGEVAATYRDFLGRLVNVLGKGRPKRARRIPPAAEYGLAGGLAALILAGLTEGAEDGLPILLGELTELVLTPYLGREEAARLAR